MGDCLARLRKERLRVAGLMSGTSADGVDAAIVDIAPGRARVVAFATIPYRPALRRQVLDLAPPARALSSETLRSAFDPNLPACARCPYAPTSTPGRRSPTCPAYPRGRRRKGKGGSRALSLTPPVS